MRVSPRVLRALVAAIAVSVGSFAALAQTPPLRARMLAAENARASSTADIAPLLEGLRSTDARTLLQAVTALGRLERPALVPQLLPFTSHARPDIRAASVNALGQSLAAVPRALEDSTPLPPEVAIVTAALLGRLRSEPDPYVAGIAAETLGRLPFRTLQALKDVEDALVSLLPMPDGIATPRQGEPFARVMHPASVTGAVKGLETRIRVYQRLEPITPSTVGRLRSAALLGSDPSDADLAFIRRMAWLSLNQIRSGGADGALIDRGLDDPDPQVRRLATLALDGVAADRKRRLTRALRDPSPIVRYDAVRVYSRTAQATDCAPVLAAVEDSNPHVALAAIDALGSGCAAGPSPVDKLLQLTDALPPKGTEWHRSAHAFVALSRVARDHAITRMPKFAEHATWQVRAYAARAAAEMLTVARLERLAADAHDNVREAAVAGLVTARGHEADAVYIANLERSDYQLLLTTANALKGSPNGSRAVAALVKAFTRLTAQQRDTSRDPRMAILERLQEFADKRSVSALRPCLTDFDPAVAQRCAAILTKLTGTPQTARPETRPTGLVIPVTARRARITMQRGGTFELRFHADEAPATVARFVGLARQGYYNGLTFHRVVPNFVIQGGSPGANEYMGDARYMRDELGLRTHARGTLGISTRGRDTGDAQIFVNLADNPRLDHNYTVFAEVTSGMDIVDRIVEGDVIARVDVLESPAAQSGR
jgi:cyclophilin family peptidyl-prolyl cis-trans isomerase/HEAT repeat protein